MFFIFYTVVACVTLIATTTFQTKSNLPITFTPTLSPSSSPSINHPTNSPTIAPSISPSISSPSISPSISAPSVSPSVSSPSISPSKSPTTESPTTSPTTESPTTSPLTAAPSTSPSFSPTRSPSTGAPSTSPLLSPTRSPSTGAPSASPSTSAPTVEIPFDEYSTYDINVALGVLYTHSNLVDTQGIVYPLSNNNQLDVYSFVTKGTENYVTGDNVESGCMSFDGLRILTGQPFNNVNELSYYRRTYFNDSFVLKQTIHPSGYTGDFKLGRRISCNLDVSRIYTGADGINSNDGCFWVFDNSQSIDTFTSPGCFINPVLVGGAHYYGIFNGASGDGTTVVVGYTCVGGAATGDACIDIYRSTNGTDLSLTTQSQVNIGSWTNYDNIRVQLTQNGDRMLINKENGGSLFYIKQEDSTYVIDPLNSGLATVTVVGMSWDGEILIECTGGNNCEIWQKFPSGIYVPRQTLSISPDTPQLRAFFTTNTNYAYLSSGTQTWRLNRELFVEQTVNVAPNPAGINEKINGDINYGPQFSADGSKMLIMGRDAKGFWYYEDDNALPTYSFTTTDDFRYTTPLSSDGQCWMSSSGILASIYYNGVVQQTFSDTDVGETIYTIFSSRSLQTIAIRASTTLSIWQTTGTACTSTYTLLQDVTYGISGIGRNTMISDDNLSLFFVTRLGLLDTWEYWSRASTAQTFSQVQVLTMSDSPSSMQTNADSEWVIVSAYIVSSSIIETNVYRKMDGLYVLTQSFHGAYIASITENGEYITLIDDLQRDSIHIWARTGNTFHRLGYPQPILNSFSPTEQIICQINLNFGRLGCIQNAPPDGLSWRYNIAARLEQNTSTAGSVQIEAPIIPPTSPWKVDSTAWENGTSAGDTPIEWTGDSWVIEIPGMYLISVTADHVGDVDKPLMLFAAINYEIQPESRLCLVGVANQTHNCAVVVPLKRGDLVSLYTELSSSPPVEIGDNTKLQVLRVGNDKNSYLRAITKVGFSYIPFTFSSPTDDTSEVLQQSSLALTVPTYNSGEFTTNFRGWALISYSFVLDADQGSSGINDEFFMCRIQIPGNRTLLSPSIFTPSIITDARKTVHCMMLTEVDEDTNIYLTVLGYDGTTTVNPNSITITQLDQFENYFTLAGYGGANVQTLTSGVWETLNGDVFVQGIVASLGTNLPTWNPLNGVITISTSGNYMFYYQLGSNCLSNCLDYYARILINGNRIECFNREASGGVDGSIRDFTAVCYAYLDVSDTLEIQTLNVGNNLESRESYFTMAKIS